MISGLDSRAGLVRAQASHSPGLRCRGKGRRCHLAFESVTIGYRLLLPVRSTYQHECSLRYLMNTAAVEVAQGSCY